MHVPVREVPLEMRNDDSIEGININTNGIVVQYTSFSEEVTW
jgi:hypothetical protein